MAVVGSGFSGLSAAAYLSKYGFEVQVFEKSTEVEGVQESLLLIMVILLIWDLVGIGCRIS
ncbi:NAD(P)-binding protein [Chryseobacterium indoltheticum]|uniref:NAD(P)-binding protein n=1 Tax=Chryseobacterium indoltheticum TaxID=254 RepID=UPI003F496D16